MPDRNTADAATERSNETIPPAGAAGHDTSAAFRLPLGARLVKPTRCEFRVWAPAHDTVELHIVSPAECRLEMTRADGGYHHIVVDGAAAGTRYMYRIGEDERPDPASRLQPEGVHGPSEVVPADFEWTDNRWKGVALENYVVYELHVGTFTPEGTFDAVVEHLDELKDLGVTAVELLPVAQFPGDRNWGYDGVYISAAQASYGGPAALKRLVNACHERGLAIVLDVVYNHLGPEGNYLGQFGPYFTDRYKTPWGRALNFDGPQSDYVRWFFLHSALQWIDEFHIDGLRVDAVHAIVDHSAEPFLQDLTTAVRDRARELGRNAYTIAESDLNDPRVITPKEDFGLGFDAQWSDDFHHSLHTLLTGEQSGYYHGFGSASDLASVEKTGYRFTGQHSAFRGRKYGAQPRTSNGAQFVICAQNHDQVGNRMLGERLSALVPTDQLRLAAAAVVLSPFIPMLFMGEEYGEKAPFQYFTSHSDEALIEAVRNGRKAEFEEFQWEGEAPDPHDVETFRRSKLNRDLLKRDEHASIHRLYKQLLRFRRTSPALRTLDLSSLETWSDDARGLVLIRRWSGADKALVAFNFSDKPQRVQIPFGHDDRWKAMMDTGAKIESSSLTLPAVSFAIFSA